MALQTSGQISLNDIHVEAGGTSGSACTLNDTDIRGLISAGSGTAMDFADWYGASSFDGYYGRKLADGNAAYVNYYRSSSSTITTYAGIRVKMTRVATDEIKIEVKAYSYTANTETRTWYDTDGTGSTLTETTYVRIFQLDGFNTSLSYLAIDWSLSGSGSTLNNTDATNGSISDNVFYSTAAGNSIGKAFRAVTTASSGFSQQSGTWTLNFKIGGYGGSGAQTVASFKVQTVARAEVIGGGGGGGGMIF